MAESINIAIGVSKAELYEQLIPQIKSLIGDERNRTAVLANVSAALHEAFKNLWTGFYIVDDHRLILGPFQGPVACMEIAYGKGVCGAAWKEKTTQVVPDVDRFPGHIACSSLSKSEIVVPIKNRKGAIIAVLDIDSQHLNNFDQWDQRYLEQLCNWIGEHSY